MKSLIYHWNLKLKNLEENLQIHKDASTNMEFTRDMRDYARNRVTSLTKEKEFIEKTIKVLKEVD